MVGGESGGVGHGIRAVLRCIAAGGSITVAKRGGTRVVVQFLAELRSVSRGRSRCCADTAACLEHDRNDIVRGVLSFLVWLALHGRVPGRHR